MGLQEELPKAQGLGGMQIGPEGLLRRLVGMQTGRQAPPVGGVAQREMLPAVRIGVGACPLFSTFFDLFTRFLRCRSLVIRVSYVVS